MAGRWRVFKEKLPPSENPMWVVWDNRYGEYLFQTGRSALAFVNWELKKRMLAGEVRRVQEELRDER